MSIRRTRLAFEDHFVQVPNAWARDNRVTRKARGLLLELMSHTVGWEITIESLVEGGKEGRDAVRAAIKELEDAGYLTRERERADGGQFAEMNYTLSDPFDPAIGKPASDNPTLGNPPTKKTITTEDHLEEHTPSATTTDDQEPITFDMAWVAWPRKENRVGAIKAWRAKRARSGMSIAEFANVITRFGVAYADTTPPQFIPQLASWINAERWNDPLPVSKERGKYEPEPPRADPAYRKFLGYHGETGRAMYAD